MAIDSGGAAIILGKLVQFTIPTGQRLEGNITVGMVEDIQTPSQNVELVRVGYLVPAQNQFPLPTGVYPNHVDATLDNVWIAAASVTNVVSF